MTSERLGLVGGTRLGAPDGLRAAIGLLETSFGISIDCALDRSGRPQRVADMSSFITAEFSDVARPQTPILSNGGTGPSLTLTRNSYEDVTGPDGRGGHILTILIPSEPTAEMVKSLGEALEPYYLLWTPADAAQVLNPVMFSELIVPSLSPLQAELARIGLPRYRRQWRRNAFHVPNQLGWLNYWSRATCAYLDFPNRAGDRELFMAQPLKNGAWFVQLTPDPLKAADPAHQSALRVAYQRFSALTN
jgi:uncharacterized protein DUF5953